MHEAYYKRNLQLILKYDNVTFFIWPAQMQKQNYIIT